jgi:hypothetical protein
LKCVFRIDENSNRGCQHPHFPKRSHLYQIRRTRSSNSLRSKSTRTLNALPRRRRKSNLVSDQRLKTVPTFSVNFHFPDKLLCTDEKFVDRKCDLCGSSSAKFHCNTCIQQTFCSSCDLMYHRHPKRQSHIRQVSRLDDMQANYRFFFFALRKFSLHYREYQHPFKIVRSNLLFRLKENRMPLLRYRHLDEINESANRSSHRSDCLNMQR